MVHNARVPECVAEEMAAPNQEGSFPSPVKFGYLSVGVVEDGPEDWLGKTVFCLYPHQDRYVVPVESLTVVPDGRPRPPRRAHRHRGNRRSTGSGRPGPGWATASP